MAEGGADVILNIAGNTRQLERDIQKIANTGISLNTKGFSQPLGKITGQLGEFEKSLAASNARVIAFGVSAGAIYAVQKAFSETIKTTIQVEKTLTEINTILSVSQGTLNQFGNSLFDIAKNTGQTFDTVSKSALEFSRQGLGLNETLKRTTDALILTRLSGMDVAASTESITAALNSFNQTAISSNELINKLIAVDAGFAVSSADLAEAIKRVGSSAQDAGVGLDELIALVTSAQQITARGGAVIGNSLKTIFTRLQRTETLDALDQLGVKTKDAEGNIMPLIQILTQLSNTFTNLSGVQKAQVAELVGGVYQINILKAALGDLSKEYSVFNQALGTSKGASDEANKRNEEMNKTMSSTFNATLTNLQKVASDIGGVALGPAIKKSLSVLNSVLENFGTTDSGDAEGVGSKIGQGIAKGLGNFLGGPGLVIAGAGLIKVFDRLIKYSVDAFKTLTGINAQSSQQVAIQSQVLSLMGKNPALIEQINKGNVNTASLHQQILTLIEAETVQMQKQLAVASNLSKSLMLSGVRIPEGGSMKGLIVKTPTKSSGFIPNFSDVDSMREVLGASFGGYKAGNIKKINIPQEGQAIYNTAETVKKFPGFNQPAIIPPKNSLAGKIYKENFIGQNGFDPYAFNGFIPNFQPGRNAQVRQAASEGKLIKIPGRDSYVYGKDKNGKDLIISKAQKNDILEKDPKKKAEPLDIGNIASVLLTIIGSSRRLKGPFFPKGKSAEFSITNVPVYGIKKGAIEGDMDDDKRKLFSNITSGILNSTSDFIDTLKPLGKNVNKGVLAGAFSRSGEKGAYGAIRGAIGSAFEVGIKSALNYTANDADKGFGDFDVRGGNVANLQKLFGFSTKLADFKSGLSEGNLMSFANKVFKEVKTSKFGDGKQEFTTITGKKGERIKKAALGFIPNFSAIKEAMNREKNASGENPEVLWSDTLGSPVVVNNSQIAKYGKNADRIIKNDHISQGQYSSYSNLMKTGSGKEKYRSQGFVPNFAKIDDYLSLSPEEKTAARSTRKVDIEAGVQSAFKEIEKFKDKIFGWNRQASTADEYLKKITQKFKLTEEEASKAKQKISEIQNKEIPIQKGSALGGVKGFFSDKNLSEGTQKYKNNAILGSFGISMAGGMAASFFEDNKKISTSIDKFSSSLSTGTALMSVVPGKAGLLIGSLTAAAGAFAAVSGLLYDKAPDLEKKIDSIKEESSNFSNGTQKYSSSLQKFLDALENPKSQSQDLIKLSKEISDAAREIPSKYRMQLLAISDNVTLQEEINKIQKELIDKQKNLEFAGNLQSKIDSSDSWKFGANDILNGILGINNRGGFLEGFGNTLSLGIGPLLNAIQPDDLKNGKKDLSNDFLNSFRKTQLAKSFDVEKTSGSVFSSFSKEGQDKFVKDVAKLPNVDQIRGFTQDELVDFLQRAYGLDGGVADALRNMAPKDIGRLKEGVISLGTDSARTAQIMKATEKVRKSTAEAIEKEKKALAAAEQSVVSFKNALDDMLKISINSKFNKESYDQTSRANQRALGLDYVQGIFGYNKSFMSQGAVAKTEYQVNKLTRQEDFAQNTQDIARKLKQDLISVGLDTIIGARSNDKGNEDAYKNAQIMLNKINTSSSPDQIKQNILSIVDTLPKSQITPGDRQKVSQKLNETAQDGNRSLLDVKQKLEQANKIAEQQLKAQIESIRKDVRLNAFGGTSSFNDLDFVQNTFDSLKKNLEGYSKTGNILPLSMQAFGATGGIMPGEERQFDQIKASMIDDRAGQVKSLALGFARSLSKVGQSDLASVFYNRADNSRQIATDQVNQSIANMDANEKTGVNIANIYGEVKTISQAIKDLAQKQSNELSPINSIIKEATAGMNQNFDGVINDLINKIAESQDQADQRKDIYENTKKYNNSKLSEEMKKEELKQRTGESPELLAQINFLDKQLAAYVRSKVEKALQEGKSIPTLSEIKTEAKKENVAPELSSKLDKLVNDSGSEIAQAFQRFIENIRSIQELNTSIQTAIETQKAAQAEIDSKIQSMNTKRNVQQNSSSNQAPEIINNSLSGNNNQYNSRQTSQNNQPLNNQQVSPQRNQNQNQNISQNLVPIQNTMNQFNAKISELILSLKTPTQLAPTKIEGQIGVNIDPLTIDGNMALGLKFAGEEGSLKIKVDYGDEIISDIVKKAVEEQVAKIEDQITTDLRRLIEESINNFDNKLNNRPRPPAINTV